MQGQNHRAEHIAHTLLVKLERFGTHHRRTNEIGTQRVGPIAFHNNVWIRVVALRLAHLAAVFS